MQLDVADSQEIDGEPVVADYKRSDNAIEMLKVPESPHPTPMSPPTHTNRHNHHQAETMHKMVETFEYDGEQSDSLVQLFGLHSYSIALRLYLYHAC